MNLGDRAAVETDQVVSECLVVGTDPVVREMASAVIERLEIAQLAIIESLEIDIKLGLSVFTGETGAGKSIIVDAIGLLTGMRAGTDLIRSGVDSLLVTGFLGAKSFSRRVNRSGRSVARIDGEIVSLRELAEQFGASVTIHGQHAAQKLLDRGRHAEALDAHLNEHDQVVLTAYRKAFARRTQLLLQLQTAREDERDLARQLDLVQYQVREIEAIAPQLGEDESLHEERERLVHAEVIAEHALLAANVLSDAEPSAQGLVHEAIRALERAGRHDQKAAQLALELREALDTLSAVAVEANRLAEDTAHDSQALERVETRLAAIERLKKYGATIADVLDEYSVLSARLATLEQAGVQIPHLEAEITALEDELTEQAKHLGRARRALAASLVPRLEARVRRLGMPGARFEFLFEPAGLGPSGDERIELLFSANTGEPLGALSRIASGGELSRIMLALSSEIGVNTPSVIFDEVDAGLGGEAAQAVADELVHLARTHQVLVVTHLAQIAARAAHHFRVRKHSGANGRPEVILEQLIGEERVRELARMLSGSTSQAAMRHAHELLEMGLASE